MKHTINLLPEKSPLEVAERKKRRTTYVFIAIGLFVVFLIWLFPVILLQNVKKEEQTLLSDIAAKEQSISALSEQERLYRTVFNKAAASDIVLGSKEKLSADMQDLKSLVAQSVTISDIKVNKNTVEMTATTLDIEAIRSYLNDLEDEKRTKIFKNLTISVISVDRLRGYRVGIRGELAHE